MYICYVYIYNIFTNFALLITWQSFLKLSKYINNYLDYNVRIGHWKTTGKEQSTRSAVTKEVLQKHAIHLQEETPPKCGFSELA